MVDARALKVAGALAVAAVLLFVASFVLRFAARILTWAVLLGLALAAGYVVYQLYAGWRAAGGEADTGDAAVASDVEPEGESDQDVESVKDRYASGELSDAEFEAELDSVIGEEAGSDREPEPEH